MVPMQFYLFRDLRIVDGSLKENYNLQIFLYFIYISMNSTELFAIKLYA